MRTCAGRPWVWGAVLLVLGACPAPRGPTSTPDAAVTSNALDAGPFVVSDATLTAWLRWEAAVAAAARVDGGARRSDGGGPARVAQLARLERDLLADAGLTRADVERLEEVIGAVVAERTVGRLTGGAALDQFRAVLADLSPEQRARAEAAFAEASQKAQASGLPALEARFGADALKVVLAREAEVTRAWDALLEARE